MVHLSLTVLSTLLTAYVASAAPADDILGDALDVATGFEQIANLTGYLYSQQTNPTPSVTYADIEQVVFNISKTVDATGDACKSIKVLTGKDLKRTEAALDDAAKSVSAGASIINRNIDAIRKTNTTAEDTSILLNVASGYDNVYHACEAAFPPNLLKYLGATVVTIICDLNEAAEAVTPGSKLVDAQYCNTFKHPKHPHPKHPRTHHPHPDMSTAASNGTILANGTIPVNDTILTNGTLNDTPVDQGSVPANLTSVSLPNTTTTDDDISSASNGTTLDSSSASSNVTVPLNGTILQNFTAPLNGSIPPNWTMARIPKKNLTADACDVSGVGSLANVDVLNCSNITILSGVRSTFYELKNCPNVAKPKLPKTLKGFKDCNQSASNLLKFSYQTGIWDDDVLSKFCSPTKQLPVWTPCTKDWQPDSWISDSKAPQVLH